MFKPFDFIKWQANICHGRSKRWSHSYAILLFIKNIIEYEIRFLSSQWQKNLKLRLVYTLFNVLIIIKQIGTCNTVSLSSILVKSEWAWTLPMKILLPWCTIFSAKAKEFFTVSSLNVTEESLETKNFASL